MINNLFQKSINQWCYGKNCLQYLPNSVRFAREYCYYSNGTSASIGKSGDKEVLIIGCCVDVLGEWAKSEIAGNLANLDFNDFIVALENLSGVFVVLRYDLQFGVRIFGDATHMMSIYYGVEGSGRGVVSSCEAFIVDDVANVSEISADINKKGAGWQCAIMGDLTMYDDVKCLLPNHYLDMRELRPIRYFPREQLNLVKTEEEIDAIIDSTINMAASAIKQFSLEMKFASPLTPGADSRVNCAMLKTYLAGSDTVYYQILTREMTALPKNRIFCEELAAKMGLDGFNVYADEFSLSEDCFNGLKAQMGPIRSWGRKIWTYNNEIKGRTIVNGQIIDHIGKGYMKTWPRWLATRKLLFVKFCNTSRFAYQPYCAWYDEARAQSKGYSLYDLLGWEIRCGRWSANLVSINSILGIRDINFWNCTKLLANLCKIPRHMRAKGIVHKKIIAKLMPQLNIVPFNPYCQRSRHLPAWLNKIVPTVLQEFVNYALKKIKDRDKNLDQPCG